MTVVQVMSMRESTVWHLSWKEGYMSSFLTLLSHFHSALSWASGWKWNTSSRRNTALSFFVISFWMVWPSGESKYCEIKLLGLFLPFPSYTVFRLVPYFVFSSGICRLEERPSHSSFFWEVAKTFWGIKL